MGGWDLALILLEEQINALLFSWFFRAEGNEAHPMQNLLVVDSLSNGDVRMAPCPVKVAVVAAVTTIALI